MQTRSKKRKKNQPFSTKRRKHKRGDPVDAALRTLLRAARNWDSKLESANLEVKPSSIAHGGLGLFAKIDIPSHTIVFEYTGLKIPFAATSARISDNPSAATADAPINPSTAIADKTPRPIRPSFTPDFEDDIIELSFEHSYLFAARRYCLGAYANSSSGFPANARYVEVTVPSARVFGVSNCLIPATSEIFLDYGQTTYWKGNSLYEDMLKRSQFYVEQISRLCPLPTHHLLNSLDQATVRCCRKRERDAAKTSKYSPPLWVDADGFTIRARWSTRITESTLLIQSGGIVKKWGYCLENDLGLGELARRDPAGLMYLILERTVAMGDNQHHLWSKPMIHPAFDRASDLDSQKLTELVDPILQHQSLPEVNPTPQFLEKQLIFKRNSSDDVVLKCGHVRCLRTSPHLYLWVEGRLDTLKGSSPLDLLFAEEELNCEECKSYRAVDFSRCIINLRPVCILCGDYLANPQQCTTHYLDGGCKSGVNRCKICFKEIRMQDFIDHVQSCS